MNIMKKIYHKILMASVAKDIEATKNQLLLVTGDEVTARKKLIESYEAAIKDNDRDIERWTKNILEARLKKKCLYVAIKELELM